MKYRLRIVGPESHIAGFRAAGLPTTIAEPDAVGIAVVHDIIREPDAGIVLTTQDLYDTIAPSLPRWLARRPLPMVVPIPSPEWQARAAAESHIVELLRRAVGYKVRLR